MSYGLSKRIFDLGFSIVVLTWLWPVFLVLWIVFRFTYPRVPFLFGVPAMGLRGKKIRLWKISTMVKNAHLMLEDILRENPAMKEEWERDYKLKNDPRILPGLGRILRKTSVNEFPQFWNVLCGELSVVGPRPISRAEELKYVEIAGEEFLEWQSETAYNSVYINFDTGLGDTPVGKIPADEIQRAVDRLNDRHTNGSPFHFEIDTIDYTHNNSWAIGGDLWNSWESIYTLAYNSLETLNVFSVIGFYYNLTLGGVGLFPWTIDSGDPIFYRVSMKGLYLTDLTAEEGRDHVFDHEVGHSLGLLHTFNYGCDLNSHGDYVDDTPTHTSANNVCDYTVDTCPDDPGNDPVDNVMNYVYGSECQMGFSIGQFDRTLWAINNWVPTLIDTIIDAISVPEDYATIQEALDSAEVGFSIHVSPGTYIENIQWPNTDDLFLEIKLFNLLKSFDSIVQPGVSSFG